MAIDAGVKSLSLMIAVCVGIPLCIFACIEGVKTVVRRVRRWATGTR